MNRSTFTQSSRAWLLLIPALLLCGTPTRSADLPTDLGGSWILNDDVSEDPHEKMMEAMSQEGGRSSGRGGGRGGGTGGGRSAGGFGGGPPGGGSSKGAGSGDSGTDLEHDREAMRESMEKRRQAQTRLNISQSVESVTVVDANGDERIYYTDGRTIDIYTERGDLAEASPKWKKGALVVKAKGVRGTVTEIWEVGGGEGQQLYLTVKTEGGRMPGFEYRRVYDRAIESEPESTIGEESL